MFPQSSTNRYGDLLKDILQPLNADASKLNELQRIFNEFSERENVYRSWVGNAGSAKLENPTISHPLWGSPPTYGYHTQRIGSQSIPDNTETAIQFNTNTPITELFENTSDAEKIRVKSGTIGSNNNRTICILGTVQWANSGVGRRGAHVNVYDESDVLITGYTLHSLLPTGIASDTLPIGGGFYFQALDTAAYIRITVIQTSGAPLNLEGARLYLFLLI